MSTKKPALVVEISECTDSNLLAYTIQIIHQKYKGYEFNKDGRVFTASNGFSLRSVDMPEAREVHGGSNTTGRGSNRLYVRGTYLDSSNDKILTVYSVSYIEELKVAIKEYNEQID